MDMLQALLRSTREQAGLTQQDMADLLGVDRAYVSRLESTPPTTAVRRLEEAFEVLGVALTTVPRSVVVKPQDTVDQPVPDSAAVGGTP